MKRLNLNPTGRTVYKISQPGVEAARQKFTIEPMRFLFPKEARLEARGRSYDQLSWCPEEYRAEYRKLRRMGLRASEAKPLVEDNIARDLVRRRSTNVHDIAQRPSGADNHR